MIVNNVDKQYLDGMRHILNNGELKKGRNGNTIGTFGYQMRFDLSEGFPLLTTKKVHFRSVMVELLWFIKGLTNVEYLHKHGVTIWDEWADENGNLGPVYGAQWRKWDDYSMIDTSIDQLANVIADIKRDPYSRRHIVSAWNVGELPEMKLPPCHLMFQFHVSGSGKLSCHLYQRSADWFLGVPFNIASYALLTHLVARECGLRVGDLVHSFGDLHIYENHIEQCKEQLSRDAFELPNLVILPVDIDQKISIFDLEPENIMVTGYIPHPAIKAPVSA